MFSDQMKYQFCKNSWILSLKWFAVWILLILYSVIAHETNEGKRYKTEKVLFEKCQVSFS